jgi:hypothetical protein
VHCASELADELGVTPGPELQTMYQAILRGGMTLGEGVSPEVPEDLRTALLLLAGQVTKTIELLERPLRSGIRVAHPYDTESPTAIVPTLSGMRLTANIRPWSKFDGAPSVRSGSLPRSPVSWSDRGHHAPVARLGHPELQRADPKPPADPVVLGPRRRALDDQVGAEPGHRQWPPPTSRPRRASR